MNNGCICYTMRGDLIRIIGSLMKRRDQFDHISLHLDSSEEAVKQIAFADSILLNKIVLVPPFFPPSNPAQRLFQESPAKSKFSAI